MLLCQFLFMSERFPTEMNRIVSFVCSRRHVLSFELEITVSSVSQRGCEDVTENDGLEEVLFMYSFIVSNGPGKIYYWTLGVCLEYIIRLEGIRFYGSTRIMEKPYEYS